MRQTVSSGAGSASRLNSLSVSVAAKTGTAQIYPSREIYHNWITLFAPYENPEIVVVVLVESVEGLRVVAQSAAKEILKYYFDEEDAPVEE
jgi:penicillin-binding protein 2